MKSSGYMQRAMRSHDPRFARVLTKLGYGPAKAAAPMNEAKQQPVKTIDEPKRIAPEKSPEGGGELASLRSQYETRFGKRPFPGWNAEALRAKLAEKPEAGRYARRDMRAEEQ